MWISYGLFWYLSGKIGGKVMIKKKVYIVFYSYWDCEWYFFYEEYYMCLIELVDNVLDLIENDLEFNSFYLDG